MPGMDLWGDEFVRRGAIFVLTVALSSAAYHYSLVNDSLWALMWLAPLPLCLYALAAPAVAAVCAGFTAVFIGFSAFLAGAGYPAALVKALLWENAVRAIAFTAALAAFRYSAGRGGLWAPCLLFAGGITAYEFLASLVSRGGTVASIAYTQTTNLPVVQIASLTGLWGITFLLSALPAGIAAGWQHRHDRSGSVKILLLPAGLLLAALVFGFCRLHLPSQGPPVRIGIVAEPITMEQYLAVAANKDYGQVTALLEKYAGGVERLAQAGAQVVLLPEKTFTLSAERDLLQAFGNLARRHGVYLIAGLTSREEGRLYNSAFAFAPNGEVLTRYDKQHLLPPFEDRFTPGQRLGTVRTPAMGLWGLAICKDMDFRQPAGDYSRQGVNIMFVPALDFHDDAWTHGRVAVMRGVEGNFPVARAGQWGLLTLTDSRGRIIGLLSTDAAQGEALLTGDLNLDDGVSLYSRLGDWFGWLCVLGFLASPALFWLAGRGRAQGYRSGKSK